MKAKKTDDWYPFFIQKWIFGSTRLELDPGERGVFVDLLTLSKMDDGFIRANEGVPYPDEQLSGMLVIPMELLQRTIKKCLSKEINKLERMPDGTLYMLSHGGYELSKRHKRRIEKEEKDKKEEKEKDNIKNRIEERASGKADTMATKADTEKALIILVKEIKGFPQDEEKILNQLRKLDEEFPKVDPFDIVRSLIAFWLSDPIKKGDKPFLRMRNFFKQQNKYIENGDKEHRVGEQRKESIPTEWGKLDSVFWNTFYKMVSAYLGRKYDESKIRKIVYSKFQEFEKNFIELGRSPDALFELVKGFLNGKNSKP